jgi:hypothetical protein
VGVCIGIDESVVPKIFGRLSREHWKSPDMPGAFVEATVAIPGII